MMTIQRNIISAFRLLPIFCLICLSFSLCGCCGGSNSVTTTIGTQTQTKTLTGTLLGFDQSVQVGDHVVYDVGTTQAQSAQTDSAGKYQLVLPLSSITGTDTLTFYDSSGHALETVPVNLTVDTTPQMVTTVLAPPNPPTGV